jgi:hypothetical protein
MIMKTNPQVHAVALGVATLATGSILAVAGYMHTNLFTAEAANDATLDARITCGPLVNAMQGIAGKAKNECTRLG